MTKESKAVIGGMEEVSLYIRQRRVVLRVSVEGPPTGPRLAAWPGLLDAVSLSRRPLVLHTCVCPSTGHREVQVPSKASVPPHLPKGACLVGQRQNSGYFFYYRGQHGPEERGERVLGYFTSWFCDFMNKSLRPFCPHLWNGDSRRTHLRGLF